MIFPEPRAVFHGQKGNSRFGLKIHFENGIGNMFIKNRMNHSPSLPLRPGWPALLAWAARGCCAAHFPRKPALLPLLRSRGLAQEAAAAARPLPCFADGWGPLSAVSSTYEL
jgi:hypothetical protein